MKKVLFSIVALILPAISRAMPLEKEFQQASEEVISSKESESSRPAIMRCFVGYTEKDKPIHWAVGLVDDSYLNKGVTFDSIGQNPFNDLPSFSVDLDQFRKNEVNEMGKSWRWISLKGIPWTDSNRTKTFPVTHPKVFPIIDVQIIPQYKDGNFAKIEIEVGQVKKSIDKNAKIGDRFLDFSSKYYTAFGKRELFSIKTGSMYPIYVESKRDGVDHIDLACDFE